MEGIVDARLPLSTRVLSRGGRRRNLPPDNARAEGFFALHARLIKTRIRVSQKRELGKTTAKAVFICDAGSPRQARTVVCQGATAVAYFGE